MDSKLKKILRGISLEIRRLLEGRYDEHGQWQGGDLERRLNELGVWRDRNAKPVEELPHLSPEDKSARRLVDGYLKLREEAGVGREAAVSEFVRESAYTWANRLFALRCMEARGIIDEVIQQKDAYGGRSMVHSRLAKKNPGACAGDDDGLFTLLFTEFEQRTQELPALFDPKSPAVALRPSVASLKKTIALLSGRETARGQDAATDEVFAAPDAFGWAYQYWNADEKERVFKKMRTEKGAKIEGADIIPATQLYTEPYMVKFLVQNSLGALWMGMYPESKLCEQWEFFVKNAACAPGTRKPVRELTFLDPAEGSGHFHLEAFDLFYAMYEEEAAGEGRTLTPREICGAILNQNLYGIDIDGRSVQIATAALWMKAKERAPELEASDLTTFHDHLVATNICLPKGKDHLQLFLQKHPEDEPLRQALELVFQGLEHADELGSLLQIEELVDAVLRRLKKEADEKSGVSVQPGLFEKTLVQGNLPVSLEDYDKWKSAALNRLQTHFETEAQAADAVQAFFGDSAGKGLTFFNVLSRRYNVVVANPPYMGSKNMGEAVKKYVESYFKAGKRDLYAAFVLQCIKLAGDGGSVAMVTMNKWLHARAYAPLRCGRELSATGVEKGDRSPLNILFSNRLTSLVDLGSRAFDPENKFHDGVQVALFVLVKLPPEEKSAVAIIDCTGPRDPEGKTRAIKGFLTTRELSRTLQSRFVDLPGSPVCYKLSDELLGKIGRTTRLGLIAKVRQGICTTHDPRFVRMFWEVALGQSNDFPEGYLRRLPWPRLQSSLVPYASQVASKAIESASKLTSAVPTEVTFELGSPLARTFTEMVRNRLRAGLDHEFIVCASEAIFQRLGYLQWDLSASDIDLVESSIGAAKIPAHTADMPKETAFLLNTTNLPKGSVIEMDSSLVASLEKQAKEFVSGEQDEEQTTVEDENLLVEAEEEEDVSTAIPMPPFGDVDAFARIAGTDIAASYFALCAAIDAGAIGASRLNSATRDQIAVTILRLLGHRWPKQIELGEPLPAWADQDGVIPLTSGGGEMPLIDRVRQRLAEDFPGGKVTALQQEFEIIVGTSLESWLAGPFFERHISQFKKRPIAWHLETQVRSRIPEAKGKGKAKKCPKSPPVFACLLYYHKLNAGLLPKIRTHYVGILKEGYETELRTLERMANRTADQEGRRLQLDAWIEEMKAFDAKLEQITSSGFGPASLRPALRQYAINDALLSLMACWLKKLNDVAASGPVEKWQAAAATTDLHDDLPLWISKAFARLDFFCAAVGPEAPKENTFSSDPTSKNLAPLICTQPAETVGKVLELACDRWWQNFENSVLTPLKDALKQAREEQDRVKDEVVLDEVKRDYERQKKLADRLDKLKKQIKALREDIEVNTDKGKRLRREIESWTCPDAATWENWLSTQPLFDEVASLDGERVPPATIAEFVAQESIYAPDINDGVRVNIAPLQKAGLLHADVLDSKDADKAISDRAEWRADERRWVREGKLPQPGWW